jgi:hypothetical protein
MLERTEERLGLRPQRLIGDTAYGTAPMLAWMVDDKGIEPHVPVRDKSDGKAELFGRSDFIWEGDKDRYICPAGHALVHGRYHRDSHFVTTQNTIIDRSAVADCRACPLEPRLCPRTPTRKIGRSKHEDARDVARRLSTTQRYAQSRRDRKKVEVLFGHLKRILKLDRLRLRGLSGAHDEFLLVATAQNLRRMAFTLGTGPPYRGTSASA